MRVVANVCACRMAAETLSLLASTAEKERAMMGSEGGSVVLAIHAPHAYSSVRRRRREEGGGGRREDEGGGGRGRGGRRRRRTRRRKEEKKEE
jgi:hypothetical protein